PLCSWLLASALVSLPPRAPSCGSLVLESFLRVNYKLTAMADRSLKLSSKNRPDAGTFDIPIQRAIFGQGPRNIMPIARDYSRAFNLFYLRVSRERSMVQAPRTLVFGG